MSAKATLLLVDLQEDYLARDGLTPDRDMLLSVTAELLRFARSHGWPVVHVHSSVDPDHRNAMPHRRGNNPEAVAGTKGADVPPSVAPVSGETVLYKRFFSAFDASGLEEALTATGTRRLVIAGVHTHACIRATVDEAYRRGFDVSIPRDAVGSYNSAHAALSLKWMQGRSAKIISVGELGATATAAKWTHKDPRNRARTLFTIDYSTAETIGDRAEWLRSRQCALNGLGLQGRRDRLQAWRDDLERADSEFVNALVVDVAKPLRDARGEIAYGLALLDSVVKSLAADEGQRSRVRFRPRGLVGLITPWNNPFAIAIGKLAPALAYGNAVLWKPALAASRISALLLSSLERAELSDWVHLATGASAAGEAVVSDPAVRAISFTGSVSVGRQIVARASVRPNPVPVQAELGGSNAAIIDSSADLDFAASDLAQAIFSFSGQRCTAIRRIIVLDDVANRFVPKLVGEVEKLKVGFPDDPSCDVGPLINQASQQRILSVAADAIATGGELLCGGKSPAGLFDKGSWVAPTLIANVGMNEPLNREEWFGPIASIIPAKDFGAAMDLHNASSFGLLGALYSEDEDRIGAFTKRAEAGILSIGRARPAFSADGPFVGWKDSGFGIPEHGRWNREFYCQVQALYRA